MWSLRVLIDRPGSRRDGVGICQAGLELADDRAEKARREEPWSEGAGRILPDAGQLSQGHSGGRGHMVKLPADLLLGSLGAVGGGQSSRLGGIRGGAQRVRAHVSDACRLAGRSGGGHRCGVAHLARSDTRDKTAADLPCDVKLATRKGARPGDRIAGAAVTWGFRLEESQYPRRAVCRPRRHNPPLGFIQRLRRTHRRIVSQRCAVT